ncbi:alpha/beta fold hydrolase, partial [Candidatus Woesearchaeota archaeon]|nr:alpha/beta fold hydrolase [Candidatus Woesearchaeota archaeon]
MRKYLLFFLVAFSLSSILVTAHHEQVYYVGFDAGGDSHVYRYDPQTSTTTSVYTIASPGAYIVSVAADTKGNYYAYIYRGLYGPSSFIIKNGQTLFSLRRADYGHLFVDLQDRLYFSLNPNFSPRGEVYRVDPTGPTLLYKTPDNLAADGFAVDSKNNLYVFVGGTLAPTLLTKNGALQYTLHRPPYTQNYGGESSMNIKDELYFLHWVYNYGGRSFIYTALYRYDTKTGRLFGPTRFTGQVVGGVATDSEGNVYMTVSSSSSPFAGSLLKNGQPVASLYRGGAVAIPQHVPVLLVHGIYSDDSMWNSLASLLSQPPYNYHVHTVGQVLGQGGLYPNNGDITSLAKQLEAATEKLGSAKVDVIAHSMGGLVTRHYMTSHFYPSNIRNFIMLGTPNAGAPIAASPVTNLARFFGLIRGDDPKDTGRYQMHPRSTFLTHLNANFLTQGATINAI